MSADNLKQRAVTGGIWYGGTRIIIQSMTWVVTVLVARVLSPSDYGLYGFGTLVTGLVDLISELGIGAAIIQRRDLEEDELGTVFWLSLSFSLFAYGITWLCAPFIASFFNQPQLVLVLRVLMLTFFISSLRIISWNLLTKRVDFKRRSQIEVAANLTGSATTLVMAYTGFGVWSLITGILSRQAMLTLGCYWILPWRPHLRITKTGFHKVFGFGLYVSASRVAWYLHSNADSFIVGKLLGQQQLGFYSMMYQFIALPVDRISSIVNQVAYPVYSEIQDQPERLKRYFLKLVGLVSLITFPLFCGMFLVVDIAIPVLLTQKWTPLVAPLRLMCGVGMLMSISVLISPAVLAKGRPELSLKFGILCLVIMPAGYFIGARYGLVGVCWAWLILYPVVTTIWCVITRRVIGYKWAELVAALKPAASCTAGMCTFVVGVRAATDSRCHGLIQLVILVGAGVGSYLIVFGLGFRSRLAELRALFSREKKVAMAV